MRAMSQRIGLATTGRCLTARAPVFVACGLGALTVAEVAGIGIRWHSARSATVQPERGPASALKNSATAQLTQILAANLFGEPAVVQPADKAATDSLVLVGTIATDQPDAGFAILSAHTGKSYLYRAGAKVEGGATLSEVFRDHIVLLLGAETKVLALLRLDGRAGAPRAGAAATVAVAANTPQTDPDTTPPPLPTAGAVLRSLNLRPAVQHGKNAGLRVLGSGQDTRALAALGLARGDVIVDVNGRSATDPSRPVQGDLTRLLSSGQTATLSFVRDGKIAQLIIDPERAESAAQIYRDESP